MTTHDRELAARLIRLGALRAEHLDGQPSNRTLAGKDGTPKSPTAIGNWFTGATTPKTWDSLLAVLETIRAVAQRRGKLAELAGELDVDAWSTAYQDAMRRLSRHTSAGVRAVVAHQALDDMQVGEPIADYRADPLRLEIHRAIKVADEADPLPFYVARPHDGELSRLVTAAGSRVIMLVGGSSTGKTRACFEAIRRLGDEWRLWHPVSPGRVEALLQGVSRVGPRTVIWLDGAQRYLMAGLGGETVAARLRELIADRSRGPVLVVGTIWRDYWRALTASPVDGAPDPHEQARALLAGCSIEVPETFTDSALAAVEKAGGEDARLAQALREADGGQITQYLAGVPALVERYRTAAPAAKALVHAAMDARRLGVGNLLLDFLADAAPGYLTDAQWDQTDEDDWLEDALQAMAAPCKGVLGPLTRIRPRSRRPGGDPLSYRLADYLEQLGRTERAAELPPASFWAAAESFLPAPTLADLAAAAKDRGLLRVHARLLRTALHAGEENAAGGLLAAVSLVDAGAVGDVVDEVIASFPALSLAAAAHLDETLSPLGRADLADRVWRHALAQAPLDYYGLSTLLSRPRDSSVTDALVAREPADQVEVDASLLCLQLLEVLVSAGADEQASRLAGRVVAERPGVLELAWLARLGFAAEVASVGDATRADAPDRAESLSVTDPDYLTALRELHGLGARSQVERLLRLDPAGQVPLDETASFTVLWKTLAEIGAQDQVDRLAERVRAQARTAPRHWLGAVYLMALEMRFGPDLAAGLPVPDFSILPMWLQRAGVFLEVLSMRPDRGPLVEMVERIGELAPRAHRDPEIFTLLKTTRSWLADDLRLRPLSALAAARPTNPSVTAWLLDALEELREEATLTGFLARGPLTHLELTDPAGTAELAATLARLDRHDELSTLINRNPFGSVEVTSSAHVTALWRATAPHATAADLTTLARRAAHQAGLAHIDSSVGLLRLMLTLHDPEPARVLAGRLLDKAEGAPPHVVASIVEALREFPLTEVTAGGRLRALVDRVVAEVTSGQGGPGRRRLTILGRLGAHDAALALAAHEANAGRFPLYRTLKPALAERYRHGREPDGSPSPPWRWRDLG